MKNKYVFTAVMLTAILVVSLGLTTLYMHTEEKSGSTKSSFVVVTSFYPMYVAAANIIGDCPDVVLKNLSEPQTGCLHDFQLTPEDMKLLSGADVFIINGGGIESFMEDIAAGYPKLAVINACEGLELLEGEEHGEKEHEEEHEEEAHGDEEGNAHAWMSVAYYRRQVETIATQLAELKPELATDFLHNQSVYDDQLASLQAKQEELALQLAQTPVILFHEAYAYVAADYGMEVRYLLDLDEERSVSAGELAELLSVIEDEGVSLILAEERYGKKVGDTVCRESSAKVIYLDTLNRGAYEADSYIKGMLYNISQIREALSKE